MLRAKTKFRPQNLMDTLGVEPRASRMLSGCDTARLCAPWRQRFGCFSGSIGLGRRELAGDPPFRLRSCRGGASPLPARPRRRADAGQLSTRAGLVLPLLSFGLQCLPRAFRAASARLPPGNPPEGSAGRHPFLRSGWPLPNRAAGRAARALPLSKLRWRGPRSPQPAGTATHAQRAANAQHAGLPTSQSRRPLSASPAETTLGAARGSRGHTPRAGAKFPRGTTAGGFGFCVGPILLPRRIPSSGLWFRSSRRRPVAYPARMFSSRKGITRFAGARTPAARGCGICFGPILLSSRIPSTGLWFRPSKGGEIGNPAQRAYFCE